MYHETRHPDTRSLQHAPLQRLLGSSPSGPASSPTGRLSRQATRSAWKRRSPWCWSGWMGSAGIGNHPRSSSCWLGRWGAVGAVGLAALTTLLAVGLAAVAAVGAASNRPGAGAGLGGVAFAVQLHHHPGAEHRVS